MSTWHFRPATPESHERVRFSDLYEELLLWIPSKEPKEGDPVYSLSRAQKEASDLSSKDPNHRYGIAKHSDKGKSGYTVVVDVI